MPEAPPTHLEQAISDAADAVYAAKKTGYNWNVVDELLQEEIPLDGTTRCKKANGSGRAANVLTESNDKVIDLYLVFIGPSYSIASFIPAAENRIERFPNVRTVAVADRTSGVWRVRAIVEREGIGLAEKIRHAFPLVDEGDEIHLVETEFGDETDDEPASGQPPSVPIVDEDEFVSAMTSYAAELDGLDALPARFVEFAREGGVLIEPAAAIDCLAAMLSSQLLLFAGPSGTGKSTTARLLSEFFAPEERRFRVEALRQWLTPDDLAGYYSVLSKQFVATPDTDVIIRLHETSVAPLSRDDAEPHGPPVLLVEEMNLSVPEGYLAPVFHGFSDVTQPSLRWPLHSSGAAAVDKAAVATYPEDALIGPFPRVLGTINIDASSQAPARKVVARSSVILLEPSVLGKAELLSLARTTEARALQDEPVGEPFLGDPLAALGSLGPDLQAELSDAFLALVDAAGSPPVSHRDAVRSLAYMAYYLLLGGGDTGQLLRRAAENAFLHCILPTIDDERFATTLDVLSECDLTPIEEGGLLAARVRTLREIIQSSPTLGGSIDFWSALS